MRKLIPAVFVLVAATSGGATDCGQIIDDPGFDVWCGDTLCRWDVEKGAVARAPTWHQADSGVELVGAEVSMAQITEVASSDGRCIGFDLIADVADDAEVHLQIDVFGDGAIELDERIPTSDWRALSYRVRMPPFYQGVRFRLTKRGGHAVLANIGAAIVPDAECVGAPLVAGARPVGVACTEDAECATAACGPGIFGGVCGECKLDSDCAGGELCAVVDTAEAHLELWRTCVAPASAPVNAACSTDAQCTTGICDAGACSLCNAATDCGNGTCEPFLYQVGHADGSPPTIVTGASRCSGGGTPAGAGAACVIGADCASGGCTGEPLALCTTSWLPRRCHDDMECPGYGFGSEPACVTVGTRGGICQ